MTLSILLALAGLGLILARAVRADRRLSGRARLPMNWSLSGDATLTAPRRLALATVPGLAATVLGLALTNPESGLSSPWAVLVLLAGFVVLQAVYLRRVERLA